MLCRNPVDVFTVQIKINSYVSLKWKLNNLFCNTTDSSTLSLESAEQLGMKCNFLSRVLYLAKWENMFLVFSGGTVASSYNVVQDGHKTFFSLATTTSTTT